MDDVERAYMSGFMLASMGIAYAGADGSIQSVNPAFAGMLGYSSEQRYKLVGRTFFSLVAPQDMQNTLKTVAQLLSGELTHIPLTQNCLRQDGTSATFSVEMNCLWKNNKVRCIVCFMRPADETASSHRAPESQPSHQPHQQFDGGFSGGASVPGMPSPYGQHHQAGGIPGMPPMGFPGQMGSQLSGAHMAMASHAHNAAHMSSHAHSGAHMGSYQSHAGSGPQPYPGHMHPHNGHMGHPS